MVESTQKKERPSTSPSSRAKETFKDISPRRKEESEEDRQRRLAAKKEKEEKDEADRKHRQFRDGVFERHRSSSRSASDSSRRAKRAQFKSQATTEGFVTMIDGYNAAIIDFNEKAQAIADRESELERIEFETPA